MHIKSIEALFGTRDIDFEPTKISDRVIPCCTCNRRTCYLAGVRINGVKREQCIYCFLRIRKKMAYCEYCGSLFKKNKKQQRFCDKKCSFKGGF